MTPPAESHRTPESIWGWITHIATYIFKLGKRIATLESRVTALEETLKTAPADACPFCGELAMRLTEQSRLLGNPGQQWTDETWTCEKC
jgi:hypothetical protein